MNLTQRKAELGAKMRKLSDKKDLTPAERTQLQAYMAEAADIRATEERQERANAALIDARKDLGLSTDVAEVVGEERAASLELRDAIRGEARSYSAMSLTAEGSYIIAPQFADKIVAAQKAAGPFYCGSPWLSTIERNQTGAMKLPAVDDTSASGYVLTENANVTEAEVTGFNSSSIGTKTFSSGIVLASNSLVEDVSGWDKYQNFLAGIIGKRLSRIQNTTFFPQLMTALTANSSASVSAGGSTLVESDIEDVVTAVDAAYRQSPSCAFVMNASTQKALALLKDSTGKRLFRKILDAAPSIYNFPVLICPNVDSVATGNKNPVLFGDLSYIFTRAIPSFDMRVLREQFILSNQTGVIIAKRGDLTYSLPSSADSAIKYINIA